MESRHPEEVSVDHRLLQVSPWQGKNPKVETGSRFVAELWSNAIMEQMRKTMELSFKELEKYDHITMARKEPEA